jgi:hypothetical protein
VAHNAGGGQIGQAAAPNPGQVKEQTKLTADLKSGSTSVFTISIN